MSKQQVASLGLGVASVISPTAAQYAGIAQQGLGILMLKYSRDDETQADGLGYRYMLNANWDPREAVKMFQMLQKTSGTDKEGQPPAWMGWSRWAAWMRRRKTPASTFNRTPTWNRSRCGPWVSLDMTRT